MQNFALKKSIILDRGSEKEKESEEERKRKREEREREENSRDMTEDIEQKTREA